MQRRSIRLRVLTLALALSLAGCGDDDAATPDAGDPIGIDASPGDAGDTTPPRVIATMPAEGASSVASDAAIRVTFSEAMDLGEGTLAAATEDGAIALREPTWSEDHTELTVTPSAPLPERATITVTVGTTFRDVAGNALASPETFTFTTADVTAPTVVASTPSDGATVAASLSEIEITFSEEMDGARGTLSITGPGAPAIGGPTWTGPTLRATVSGLAHDATYAIALEGFRDLAGNALDLGALGDDGALTLTLGPDVEAPHIVASTPAEGQVDVEVGLVTRVAIDFSEPMDPERGTAVLTAGDGAPQMLAGEWALESTRAIFSVSGRLALDAAHRVVLEGFADAAGNPLDDAYLVDGALDFTTGRDAFTPHVAYTTPEEGAVQVPVPLDEIAVVFNEAMDTSVTAVPLIGDGRTVQAPIVWGASGSTAEVVVRGLVQAGREYELDLRALRDAGGTGLDAAHPYLADGRLDFTFVAPRGERCGDALTETEATAVPGGLEWVIAESQVIAGDGSIDCDSSHAADALVRYRKTTPSTAGGGTVLRVRVEAAGTDDLDFEVLSGTCDPTTPAADAARLRCAYDVDPYETWLDVGAGEYFVWIATETGTAFDGATVTIDEIALPPEGESCTHPFDTTSTGTVYTAPASAGAPHTWTIPAGGAVSLDRGVSHRGEGSFSCASASEYQGADAVVTYEKSSATSLVTVEVQPAGSTDVNIEVATGDCDPRGARTIVDCREGVDSAAGAPTLTLGGPPTTVSAWIGAPRASSSYPEFPGATVRITELEPGPGDTCATAIPISASATNATPASRPYRAYAPSCLTGGGVTWYRYRATRGLAIVRANGSGTAAVVEPGTGRELRCGDDVGLGAPVFAAPGTEVCVAVSSSPSITQITIDELDYTGVRGDATEIPIVRPAGAPVTPTLGTSGWLATMNGQIWTGRFQNVFHAPVTGGDYAWFAVNGFSCRYAGMARPDGLYCLSESSAVGAARLHRITDATGTPLATPEPVDVLPTGFTYPNLRFDGLAFDGTSYIVATSSTSGTALTPSWFFSIPAAGGAPTLLGTSNVIHDVGSLAVDADYLYIYGRSGTAEAIYRLRRDQLSDPDQAPVIIATGYDLITDGGAIAVDSNVSANYLYFRPIGNSGSRADVIVAIEPRAAAPRWVGPIWVAPGNRQDNGLFYDPAGPSIWLIHTNGDTSGRWVRLD